MGCSSTRSEREHGVEALRIRSGLSKCPGLAVNVKIFDSGLATATYSFGLVASILESLRLQVVVAAKPHTWTRT